MSIFEIVEKIMFFSFIVDTENFDFSIICRKSDKITGRNELTETIVMGVGSCIRILTERVFVGKLNSILIFVNEEIILFAFKFNVILIFYLHIRESIPCFKVSDFIKTYPMIQPSWYKHKRIRLVFINCRVSYKTSMTY